MEEYVFFSKIFFMLIDPENDLKFLFQFRILIRIDITLYLFIILEFMFIRNFN